MQRLTEADPERLRRLVADGEFFWLDLLRPEPREVELLPDAIGLDGEAAERALRFGSAPQLRRFRGHAGLVFYGADVTPGRSPRLVEVHVFVSGGWLVTVRKDELPALDELDAEIRRRPDAAEADV